MASQEISLLDLARNGDLEAFQKVFNEPEGYHKVLNEKDEYSQSTPFHMAAANGHHELLKLLIENIPENLRKENVNAVNYTGNTALHWAALTGSLECVKLLCEAGADPLLRNSSGIDSCYQADTSANEEVASYLYSLVDVPEGDEDEIENEQEQEGHQEQQQ
ncbi:hypothetical protein FF38_07965 [Lucilia cuprina]|uniref:Uncharacterized protein n=1 Tax=Lucilia cuprina TaxID=7375 RepID=A0A0L0C5H2_LUCCU|nr:hypothetical protein FF38_07965 [Lucilia cuprina]